MASNLAWGRGTRLATAWSYAFNEVRMDSKDGKVGVRSIYAITVAGAATAFILRPGWATALYGEYVKQTFYFTARATAAITLPIVGLATSAYGLAVIIPVVTGGIISDRIDEEEGFDNYTGFLSAGWFGNVPNYWNTDDNDSGYFNVLKNLQTVGTEISRTRDRVNNTSNVQTAMNILTGPQPSTDALTWTIVETNKKVSWWENYLGF